jgi:meiotic recombination protein SPO11
LNPQRFRILIIIVNSIPIVALVDGDAYGLDILSVYKYGSHSLRHENKKLAAKRIEWLGLWASEIAEYLDGPITF